MNTFRLGAHLLKRNIRSIVIFELAYRLICIAILLPLLTLAFRLSLWLAGYRYLSEDRIVSYLMTPTTIVILLFLLLSISIITVYEVFCIIPAFHASYHNQTISVTQMFQHGLYVLRKSFRKKNISIFVFTLILIPLTNLTIISGYVSSITIPDFILYYLRSQKTLFQTLVVLFLILFFISVQYCLSLHIFCLEPGDFSECTKRSHKLVKGSYLRTLGGFFGWNIMLFMLLVISCLLCLMLTSAGLSLFAPASFNSPTLIFVLNGIMTVFFDAYAFFTVPIMFSLLGARYYLLSQRQNRPLPPFRPEGRALFGFVTRRIFLGLVLATALFNLLYLKIAVDTGVFWNQNIIDTTTITAHRGDSSHAPENSIEAFDMALTNHADVLELDVQLTKDDVVVVVHDFNLRRLTGVNKNVWDLTYEELLDLDISHSMKEDHSKTSIPTLEEILNIYKGEADLNIELKPNAHTEGLEKKVVSLIEETDYIEHCVVASRNIESIKKIKSLNEEIKTIYLLPLAIGNYAEMTYADGLSVKSSFITQKLVNHVHDNGKVIYAWTVNSDNDMERMFSLGVDSLITDKPLKATEVYYSQKLNPVITTWIRQLTGHAFSRKKHA